MKQLMRNAAFGAVAAAFTVATAAPAFAKPPHCPPGHAKKGWCSAYDHRDRHHDRWDRHDAWDDRRDEARAWRDGYEEGRRDAIRYNGRTYTEYTVIRDYDRHGLRPPPRGHYYAEVDGDILMVQLATSLVTGLLGSSGY